MKDVCMLKKTKFILLDIIIRNMLHMSVRRRKISNNQNLDIFNA